MGFGNHQVAERNAPTAGHQVRREGEVSRLLGINGVKVFSASMFNERCQLGERITEWIRSNPSISINETIVTQSSDRSFHCVTITLLYNERL